MVDILSGPLLPRECAVPNATVVPITRKGLARVFGWSEKLGLLHVDFSNSVLRITKAEDVMQLRWLALVRAMPTLFSRSLRSQFRAASFTIPRMIEGDSSDDARAFLDPELFSI